MKLTPEDIRIMKAVWAGSYTFDGPDSEALKRLSAVAYTAWDESNRRLMLTAAGMKALKVK